MRNALAYLPWLALLASCSSPPKPPTVDESQRRPVNSQLGVELQVCKSDLHSTRLLASESGRMAESAAASLATMAARQELLVAMQVAMEANSRAKADAVAPAKVKAQGQVQGQTQANTIYTLHFDFGSAHVAIPAGSRTALITDAKAAPLVLLRGRTDGNSDALVESSIARERAAAVRDYLVASGVDAARIRVTHQPVGDHVADNSSASGRSLNRRVEVELYRAMPVAMAPTSQNVAAQP